MNAISSAPFSQGFPPVINQHTHTLILGSFPGIASLEAQQYYAFPANQFWRLLSAVLNSDLVSLPYPERLQRLLSAGIGLWDIYRQCEREGSLDSAIRKPECNDFVSLRQQFPQLQRVAFNGKVAARLQKQFCDWGLMTLTLPSSSPAHASWSFAQKLEVWQQLCDAPAAP
ncbi:DNA-deoxyinosine glycosylase [Undibacterium luofuense]|uniref:DNA-deoxyinosine glycosylase n=1 Tax=Undibacterium luofuense TaxID=2828733 RepID=A0A941DM71_9BURK|nr:DNA-deoxyinosine glycosylase [Undibacterium luofuense]MBR7783707.1 DNA-deoxyinosine glycosylase [Undibacterium luofuense]